ncbi:ATP-dependent DNA helicase RecQ [Pricia sp. S334]|uniref:ATP-dependent DNA helicase RecQ n=1 Tax=Pricia mediterranea TaxID=3076079 RepID=A0ABU3L8L3_9FLAO|nr:ATP-dependent DNA helicase RecQ [Pricia sp. S334]MDT7830074.1 ATP-dependent DNA helicase RecQ [Pricia sp. S334]
MHKNPEEILREFWGFTAFKGSQKRIIEAVLSRRDVLALMPTGGGKSLCFQIPALARDGLCIVVSPLIALIQDQVNNLKLRGIKAMALTGGIPFDELITALDNCRYGGYKFVYISPERLQQELVQDKIQQMNVNLIAIDEAHCISQWGHDFRPAYLECGHLRELLPETPIIALTATATNRVEQDIVENLGLTEPMTVKDSFFRPNIAFEVLRCEDKHYRLEQCFAESGQSGIVYVRTRKMTQDVARFLNANGCTSDFFHGGIPKKEKQEKLNLWLNNRIQVMVATNAFGMGVDKPDVRTVVHFQVPDCLENYYQEAGRAGRDGAPAKALLLTNDFDVAQMRQQFLGALPDAAFLKKVYNKLNNYFQISFGESTNEIFQFPFRDFISAYGLNSFLTYNALRILDRYSVIALSESFFKKTEIRFIVSQPQIFDYLEKNRESVPIIQSILRTYGGIFDFETKIDPDLIARKTNTSENKVFALLEKFNKDEIIDYRSQKTDLEITFLVPRDDDRTINVFAQQVEDRNRIKVEKVDRMIGYLNNDTICRSVQILDYFGEEKIENCGLCDVCRRKNAKTVDFKGIAKQLRETLGDKSYSSRVLIRLLDHDEASVLKTLQLMLENGDIKVNTRNEYEMVVGR